MDCYTYLLKITCHWFKWEWHGSLNIMKLATYESGFLKTVIAYTFLMNLYSHDDHPTCLVPGMVTVPHWTPLHLLKGAVGQLYPQLLSHDHHIHLFICWLEKVYTHASKCSLFKWYRGSGYDDPQNSQHQANHHWEMLFWWDPRLKELFTILGPVWENGERE